MDYLLAGSYDAANSCTGQQRNYLAVFCWGAALVMRLWARITGARGVFAGRGAWGGTAMTHL
jgi:hypothetical protein